jgi:hypothetical protein
MFDRIKRAWAVWALANFSYGCMLDGGYGYDRQEVRTHCQQVEGMENKKRALARPSLRGVGL